MRRLAIVFAVLMLLLQPRPANTSRGLIGLLGEATGPTPTPTSVPPAAASASPTPPPLPTVTLATVFESHAPSLANLDKSKLITLITTGNVSAARTVNYEMAIRGDYTFPFRQTYTFTRAADMTLADLESPLCPVIDATATYCGDPQFVKGLELAGISVVSLPDYHIGGYGMDSITETETHLDAAHIVWAGFGTPAYEEVNNVIFGFVSFNGIGEDVDTTEMANEIRLAHKTAQVVVATFHWGKSDSSVPQSDPGTANQDPRVLAHLAVDDGANLVIGNYPTWLQGVEIYHGVFISYASGNFVFDQTDTPETSEGVVGTYTFYGTHLVSARFRAVEIANFVQPHFVPARTEISILARMKQASMQIQAGYPDPSSQAAPTQTPSTAKPAAGTQAPSH
jgi:poly-gamma-glutamate synthesis protein (capsule biosynthesis protein)